MLDFSTMAHCFVTMVILGLIVAPVASFGLQDEDAALPDSLSEPRWWASDADDATVPFPYINEPVQSWVYDEVQRQITQGNLSGIHHNSRPLSRALIAARVAQALAEGKTSVGLMRLAREMAWEGRMMGLEFSFEDTRSMISLGPPESHVKFNGLVSVGGRFEKGKEPDFADLAVLGFRGSYWHPTGFSISGDFLVTDVPNASAFGDPIFNDTDVQFNAPRYGISWHGRFFEAWFARENLQWGPGRRGGLLAGGGADPYAQLGYRVHLGTFLTASAVHGWLSQAERRFVAYHRVEMKLGKRIRWGLMEGVRYDATAPEPLYVINLVPYSAVERLLSADASDAARASRDSLFRSNFILSTDLYWNASKRTAFYGEFMVDDIQRDQGLFDPKAESGVPVRIGYQLGALYVTESVRRLTLQAEYTRIYNYTYSVFYGRDFFHRDEPLGYVLGPDVSDFNLWVDFDLDMDWMLQGRAFFIRTGEGNNAGPWCPEELETDNPFGTECQSFGSASGNKFAGIIERRTGFELGAVYAPRDNLRFEASGGLAFVDNLDHLDGEDQTRPIARLQAAWRW
jgi:hypothetical protein